MTWTSEDNQQENQEENFLEDDQPIIRRAHPISPSKKQEGILKSGVRAGGTLPARKIRSLQKRKRSTFRRTSQKILSHRSTLKRVWNWKVT